ncbi:MAG: sensor histidine kinase [Solirubrobacterales bacterium]
MEIFNELILDIIEAVILLCVFQVFMGEKNFISKHRVKAIGLCITITAFLYWSTVSLPMEYHTFFNVVFSVLALTFFTEINIFSAMMVYFIFTSLILVTEISVITVMMLILHLDLQQMLLNQHYMFIFTLSSKLIQIGTTILLFRYNLSLRKFRIFSKENSIYSNFVVSFGIFGVFTLSVSLSIYKISNSVIYNLMLFGFYIAFFIISLKDLIERDKLVTINNKYKIQEYQIKNMEQIISITREEKHDYANHINVMQALCTLNKPNTMERIKEYVADISDSIHSSFKYLDTGNDYIDGLLAIKSSYAAKNDIQFQVLINEPFSTLKVKADELISIVSNLVDNAFEAFEEVENIENRHVSLETQFIQNKFVINITNNGAKIPEEILEQIFSRGFSTKKGSERGFGLFITKELVEKNNGKISVKSNELGTNFTVIFDVRRGS